MPTLTDDLSLLTASQAAKGLPVGLQVIGKKWSEMGLLNTAEQIAGLGVGYRRPRIGEG